MYGDQSPVEEGELPDSSGRTPEKREKVESKPEDTPVLSKFYVFRVPDPSQPK